MVSGIFKEYDNQSPNKIKIHVSIINILSQNVANMVTISNVTDIVIIFENSTNEIHYES